MKALTLAEFAEELWRKGDWREADFGAEIRELLVLEEEVAEPYSSLLADLEMYAPNDLGDKPEKALEWLGDRSNMLVDIEKQLAQEGYSDCDPDDAIRNIFEKLNSMESTLEELQVVVDAQPNGKLIYDL